MPDAPFRRAYQYRKPVLRRAPLNLNPVQQAAANTITGAIAEEQATGKPQDGPQVQALTTEYQQAANTLKNLVTFIDSKAAGRESGVLPDNEVQIGIVRLEIPPEKITVHETPNLIEVPGLRTDGNTVIKSGKGRISIILDLVFNNDQQVNNQLRKLIAQFRSYPYVPLVSQYVSSIVQPKLQRALPPDAATRLDANASEAARKIDKVKKEIRTNIDALLSTNPSLKAAASNSSVWTSALERAFSLAQTLKELQGNFSNLFTVLAELTKGLIGDKAAKATLESQELQIKTRDNIKELQGAIVELEKVKYTRSMLEVGGFIDVGAGIVPTCLDQLQIYTEPERPRLLRARLVLSFFNSGPFGGVLQYKDILGRPTIDPGKALYFQNYLESTWLKEPIWDPASMLETGTFGRSAPPLGLGTVAAPRFLDFLDIFYADTQVESDGQEATKAAVDQQSEPSMTETMRNVSYVPRRLSIGNEPSTGIIRALNVTLSNRLAYQQVQGEYYPTAQYMGGKPAYAEVEIYTTNEAFVQQIHAMKIATQRMSTLPLRQSRRPEVHISNSILNLMGIFTAQVDNILTDTISPNTTKVVLRLVEHRIDIQEREQLVRPTLFSKKRIKDVLFYLVSQAKRWVNGRSPKEIVENSNPPPISAKNAHALLYAKAAEMRRGPVQTLLHRSPNDTVYTFNTDRHEPSTDPWEGKIFHPSVIEQALFLSDNPRGPEEAQASTRAQVLLNADILRPDQVDGLTNEQLDSLMKDIGESRAVAEAIVTRWGYGAVEQLENLDRSESERSANAFGRIHRVVSRDVKLSPIAPTSLEIDLIAEYLFRSSGNVADEIRLVEENNQIKIVRADGYNKTPDIKALFTLIDAIEKNIVVSERTDIRTIGLGATTIKDLMRDAKTAPSMLYPDLHLPTYKQMLRPLLKAIEDWGKTTNTSGPTVVPPNLEFNKIKEVQELGQLPQEIKSVLGLFIPTFRQIAQIPDRSGLTLDDFAYSLDDDVLPDFPYFGASIRALIDKSTEKSRELIDKMRESHTPKRNADGFLVDKDGKPRTINDPLAQRHLGPFDRNIPTEEREQRKKQKKVVPIGSRINTETLITGLYGPSFDQTSIEDIGINTEETFRAIFEASNKNTDDNLLTMRRCFPTFRLFFIEEDTKEGVWKAIDDLYGYNSVISLTVTRHKYQADLAEVKVTNLEGNLESDKFGTSTARGGGGDPRYRKRTHSHQQQSGDASSLESQTSATAGPREPGTGESPQRRFPLSEGTRIKIEMGYQSNPRFLETVFTGKIAEVTMGDIVTFVAQGYLQELLFPMVNNPNTEKTRGVIETVMNSETVQHFGTWTPFTYQTLSQQEKNNGLVHSGLPGFLSSIGDSVANFYADPKLRNVWAAQYGTYWGEVLSRILFQDKWETAGGTKTGWDVVQDIVSYTPGYVAAVVPYDSEATLFVGRPEQPYFWTDSMQDVHNDWTESHVRRKQATNDFVAVAGKEYFVSEEYDGGYKSLDYPPDKVAEDPRLAAPSTRAARLVLWAEVHPLWTALLERADTTGTYQNEARIKNIWTGSARIPGLNLSYADLDPQKNFIEKLRERLSKSKNLAVDYTAAHRLLGGTEKAKDFILRLLGQILQRGTRADFEPARPILDIGVAPTQELTTQLTIGFAPQLLPRINDPGNLFNSIWTSASTLSFANRVSTTLNDIGLTPLTANDAPLDDRAAIQAIQKVLTAYRMTIPVAMASIRRFIESNILALNLNLGTEETGEDTWPMSPRLRPFRSYHSVTSADDILDNQMAATRGAMWNTVAISSGAGSPLIIKADDGILKGDTQLRYFREPNADLDFWNVTNESGLNGLVNNKFLVGFSRIAEGLRYMYRGHLVLRGRPNLKPWDVLTITDTYNMIFGPIEIERVTHHFSAETGFITTVVPHLVAIPNNQIDCTQILLQGWSDALKGLGLVAGVGLVTGGLTAGALGAPLGIALGIGAALGGKSLVDFISNELYQTDLVGLMVGNGQFGNTPSPVKIFPLTRYGAPWVASIRGWGQADERSWSGFVHEGVNRLGHKADDAWYAFKRKWNIVWGGLFGGYETPEANQRLFTDS